jgi:hypothetical protein
MAEARRLKSGRWRIYSGAERKPVRGPESGAIATFGSLAEARLWWQGIHPEHPPLKEEPRCSWCGAYFGPGMHPVNDAGRWYHSVHTPSAIGSGRTSMSGRL